MCNSSDAKKQIIAFCFPSTRVIPRLQTYENIINTIHFNYYFEHELHNTLPNLLCRNAVHIRGIFPDKEDEINFHLPFTFSHPVHNYFSSVLEFPDLDLIICFFMRIKGIKYLSAIQ